MNVHLKLLSPEAFFSLKCSKYRLAAGLRPDPLGELTALPRPPSCIKGCLLLREERGGEGMVEKGGGRRREGWGGDGGGGGIGRSGEGRGEYASLALGGWTPLCISQTLSFSRF